MSLHGNTRLRTSSSVEKGASQSITGLLTAVAARCLLHTDTWHHRDHTQVLLEGPVDGRAEASQRATDASSIEKVVVFVILECSTAITN